MANRIGVLFKGNFLYYFSEVISATCRFRISGQDRLEEVVESGKPLIGTSWHGMTMMVIGSLRNYIDLRSVVTIIPWRCPENFSALFNRSLPAGTF